MDAQADGRRPTKLVLVGVLVFVVAVVLGRLLVAGGAAWVLFGLALPLLLVVLGRALGLRAALVLAGVFTAAVLGTRWFMQHNPAGWIALLLLPVVALTALVVGKVLGQMRRDRAQGPPEADGDGETAP